VSGVSFTGLTRLVGQWEGYLTCKNTLPNSTTAEDSQYISQLTQTAGDAATLPIHQIYFSCVIRAINASRVAYTCISQTDRQPFNRLFSEENLDKQAPKRLIQSGF